MVALLELCPIPTQDLWSSVRVTLGFLVTSLSKALLHRLLSFAAWPALGRVLVVPNFFHLRTMRVTVLLETLSAAENFCKLMWENKYFDCSTRLQHDESEKVKGVWIFSQCAVSQQSGHVDTFVKGNKKLSFSMLREGKNFHTWWGSCEVELPLHVQKKHLSVVLPDLFVETSCCLKLLQEQNKRDPFLHLQDRQLWFQLKIRLSRNLTLGCDPHGDAEEDLESRSSPGWQRTLPGHPCLPHVPFYYLPIDHEHPESPCN